MHCINRHVATARVRGSLASTDTYDSHHKRWSSLAFLDTKLSAHDSEQPCTNRRRQEFDHDQKDAGVTYSVYSLAVYSVVKGTTVN